VEAASRTVHEPTHKRLEGLIEAIFRARVNDGQLDKTDLTFSDLSRIKETFLAMLLGIHHGRVRYPGQQKVEDEAEREQGTPEKREEGPLEPSVEPTLRGDGGAENIALSDPSDEVVVAPE
jgi:hypothetical protein